MTNGLVPFKGGCLIQVTTTAFAQAKNRDFENWPLNTGPLYTGLTVSPWCLSFLVKHVQLKGNFCTLTK